MSSWLGRNGMNGSGGWVPIRVGLNDINAYYDGTQVQIGNNQPASGSARSTWSPTSSATASTTRPPAASRRRRHPGVRRRRLRRATEYYDNQSASYDAPDWTVGEEINLVGQGPIRNMSNPAAVGDPACYTSSIPSTEVHAAAGPGNHFFYLLSRAARRAATAPTVYRHRHPERREDHLQRDADEDPSSSYLKYRTWTLTAAKNLDSTCAQFNAVKAAWDAVNVPAQTADPTCGGTTPPPTGGNLLANPGFSPAPRRGPATPASSPPTPAARPAPAPTRRGSAATPPPRPRR